MKPTLAFVFFLASGGILLASQTSPATYAGKRASLLEELVQMSRAGSSDVELLAYAKAHRRELPPEVSDPDLQYLRDSGLSERVVSYMTAIDVRVSSRVPQEGAPSASEDEPQAAPPRPNDSYPQGESIPYDGGYSSEYAGNDPGSYAFPDSYAYSDAYGDGRCGSQWGYDCYPYFNSYYPYSYYPYTFFAFQPFRRFHDHVHHFHDGHGSNGNGWRGKSGTMTNARVASRDAWRQRSFNGVNASMRRPTALGQRGSARTVFARQGMGMAAGSRATRSMVAPRGPGTSGPARGSFAGLSRAPRPSMGGGSRGSVGHPSFSGGGMRAGGGGMHAGGGARGGGGRH
ncbi:MAG TPA: hypothetical protein VJA66_06740 [Thermoanaerobaculia bacterium]